MKRFFAFTLALCISFSTLTASASSGGGGGTRGGGAGRFPDYDYFDGYDQYVQELQETYSSTIFSKGAVYYPLKITKDAFTYLGNGGIAPYENFVLGGGVVKGALHDDGKGFSGYAYNSYNSPRNGDLTTSFITPNTMGERYIAPFDSIVSIYQSPVRGVFQGSLSFYESENYRAYQTGFSTTATTIEKGKFVLVSFRLGLVVPANISYADRLSYDISYDYAYLVFTPTELLTLKYLPQDAGIIYGYDDGSGNLKPVSNSTIINSSSTVFTNPVTNNAYDIDNIYYDYFNRAYYIDSVGGDRISIVYHDDSVELTENNNTTIIYYYLSEDSEDNGSSKPDGESSNNWGSVGDLLGKILTSIASFLGSILNAILDALTSLLTVITESLGNIVSGILSVFEQFPPLFMGFASFLAAVFPFLPTEIISLLFFGLAAVVFVGILRVFLNR